LLCAVGVVVAFLVVPGVASAAVFVVNTEVDSEQLPANCGPGGDESCVSLRSAIQDANSDGEDDTITFEGLPAGTVLEVEEGGSLPEIFDPVTIDGFAVEGGPTAVPGIELVAKEPSEFSTGFDIRSGDGTRIEGLAIGGFEVGIQLGLTEGSTPLETQICGNYIGVGIDGETPIPNNVGVEVERVVEATEIGDGGPCAGNVIAANTGYGVFDSGFETTIAGNDIGVGPAPGGAKLPNGSGPGSAGIFEAEGAEGPMIGGTDPTGAAANLIWFNHGPGVFVEDPASEVSIRHDSFLENESKGIEIPDGDQPAPTIESAGSRPAGGLTVEGTVTGASAGEAVELEFFGNRTCDESGSGEGQTFLGVESVTVGAGATPYSFTLPVEVPADQTEITATATREAGATSEFSLCAPYAAPQTFTVTTLEDTSDGECTVAVCSLRDAIDAADGTPSEDTIDFGLAGKIRPFEQDLPGLTEPVTIDGTSAPGFSGTPVVEIDGTEALNEGPTQGLIIFPGAEGSTVEGLAITNFGEGMIVDANHTRTGRDEIAHNGELGILVSSDAPATAIRRSEIYDDGGTPIEFETPNSVPAPELESLVAGPGATTYNVPLVGGLPDETYEIDVFANAQCEGSGFGPAEVLLASGPVTTEASGNGVAVIHGGPLTGIDAESFTATATETATGTTSQLSLCEKTAPVTEIETKPPAVSNSSNATFTFSATDFGQVAGFECSLDGAAFAACATPKSYTGLSEGSHTFRVRAFDAEGTRDPVPPSYIWTVDTEPPEVAITAGPSGAVNSTSATFEFTATGTGSPVGAVECSLDGGAFAACTSPKNYTTLGSGPHTFEVKATDEAGNTSTPVSRAWRIQTEAPMPSIIAKPPASTESTGAVFEFDAGPEAQAYECRLDGGAFQPCTSPRELGGLAPGAHTFAVRSTDAAGNTSAPTAYEWTVAGPPPQASTASPPATEGPTPTNGEKVIVKPEEGKVLIRLPGTKKFVPLKELKEIPVGAVIDATNGRVKLTSIDPDGTEQSAEFFGGVFRVKQREGSGLVVLELLDSKTCPATASRAGTFALASAARPARASGKLWGSGHGSFRTEGNDGSATVRGTIWLVEDRCDGTTFFKTRRGVVSVRDFIAHKTLPLPAGKTYLAGEG
jgi:CSLREA domain-containing protein